MHDYVLRFTFYVPLSRITYHASPLHLYNDFSIFSILISRASI